MKRLIWVLILTVFWFGCRPGVPADIISPDIMEKVLYDIHITDGYLSTIPTVDSAKKVAAAYYNGIYKKFDIDSAIYNRSLDYYYKNPEALSKIYKNINTTLNSQTKAIQRADSLISAKKINAQILLSERKEDSLQINLGYDIDRAEKGLYMRRYNDIHSKNGIIFNVLRLKNEADTVIKSKNKPLLKTDSLSIKKLDKLKMEQIKLKLKTSSAVIK